MTENTVCQSCNFPAGYRTGTVQRVRMNECVGDWHGGDEYALCDDCLRHGDPSTFTILTD